MRATVHLQLRDAARSTRTATASREEQHARRSGIARTDIVLVGEARDARPWNEEVPSPEAM